MEDYVTIVLLAAVVWSIWLTVLFVLLCKRVKAIRLILMAGLDVEEEPIIGGSVYRKTQPHEPKEKPLVGTI